MNSQPASRSAWSSHSLWQRLLLFLLLLPALSCTEGDGGFLAPGKAGGLRLSFIPRYHYTTAAVNAIDGVRLTVISTATGDTLHRELQQLDLDDDSWDIRLEFSLPAGQASASVFVLIELLSGSAVEWSGRTSPMMVTPASTTQQPDTVHLFQGPPENLDVTGVQITTPPPTLTEGDTTVLVALTSPVGRGQIFWRTPDSAVARVNATGVVTTRRDGTARIIASAGPHEDTTIITVRQRPASIVIAPGQAMIGAIGRSVALVATVLDPRGAPIEGAAVTWSTAHPELVRSLGDGSFTALANGAATVIATSVTEPDVSATATLLVAQQPTTMTFNPAAITLTAIGESVQLVPLAQDEDGHAVLAATYTWSSSAPAVVSVDESGNISALANGTARITANFPATGASASMDVTVSQVLASILVQPAEFTFTALDDSTRFTATPADRNGHPMQAVVTWSSSDPQTVSIDDTGLARALRVGSVTVTASAGAVSGTALVNVLPDVTQVEITPAVDTLTALGASLVFSALGRDRNGHTASIEPEWSSSDPAIVTIDGTGRATARAAGSVIITARYGSVSATAELVVVPAPHVIEIQPDTLRLHTTFRTAQLHARLTTGTGVPIDSAVTWTSLDPRVATVDETGTVMPLNAGITGVVASYGETADTAVVIFEPIAVSIELTPATDTVLVGHATQFSAIVRDSAGVQLAREIAWSISPAELATIDVNGQVTALAAGAATVIATSDALSARAALWITEGAPGIDLAITRVSIAPGDTVVVGDTVTITATVHNLGSLAAPPTNLIVRGIDALTGFSIGETTIPVPGLQPGDSITGSYSVILFPEYTWPTMVRMAMVVDTAGMIAELDENNNHLVSQPIVILAAPPQTGLPADVFVQLGDTLTLPTSLTNPAWRVESSSYVTPLDVDEGGGITTYAYGAAQVIASRGGVEDTTLVWVVPPHTRVWTGQNAFDTSWKLAGNWYPAGVPTAADDVFIPDCDTYFISCGYPRLTGDAVIHGLATGMLEYYVSPVERPARVMANRERLSPVSLGDGAAAFDHLREQTSRIRTAPTAPRPRPRPRESMRRPAANPLAAGLASSNDHPMHVDLAGHVLTISGDMPQFTSIGSWDEPAGTVRFVGTNQQAQRFYLRAAVELAGIDSNIGEEYYSEIEGAVSVTGSIAFAGSVYGDVSVPGALQVTDGLEVEGDLDISGTMQISDGGWVDHWGRLRVAGNYAQLSIPSGAMWAGMGDDSTRLTVENGARVDLGIGGRLEFYGALTLASSSAIVLAGQESFLWIGRDATITGNGTLLQHRNSSQISGNLLIDDRARVEMLDGSFWVTGGLRTSSAGVVFGPAVDLRIDGDAIFQGGHSHLGLGVLFVGGDLIADPDALALDEQHFTVLSNPDGPQLIDVHNTFGRMELGGGPGGNGVTVIARDLVVTTELWAYTHEIRAVESAIASAAIRVRAGTGDLNQVTFHNTWLDIGTTTAIEPTLHQLTFSYDASVSVGEQLRLEMPEGTSMIVADLTFDGSRATPLAVINSSTGSSFTFANPSAPPRSVLTAAEFAGSAVISFK